MVFNSIEFLLFFPITTFLYFVVPHRFRWAFLLVASCLFYMTFIPAYILILLATIVVDYWAAILIDRSRGSIRKLYLTVSIIATCLILFVFKYYNFFMGNLNDFARLIGWNYSVETLAIILPIGLSFHTFQSLSYVIEVYRGHQKPERHFGIYSVFVMFYPQLVAGPIERPQNLLHQFRENHHLDFERLKQGLQLMLWGLFKKMVVADRLSVVVDAVYNAPDRMPSSLLVLGTVFFAIQIYCDFSGYSDIARGSARVLGFDLMVNFNRPYISKSISEFWRRWHVSLSSWFKDYVYIPLGGNRKGTFRTSFNLLLTFILSGFWHGANWTFIAWGALNGFFLVMSNLTTDFQTRKVGLMKINVESRVWSLFNQLITFALICLTWIYFRARNIAEANSIVLSILTPSRWNKVFPEGAAVLPANFYVHVTIGILAILTLQCFEMAQGRKSTEPFFANRPTGIRWAAYYGFIIAILIFGIFEKKQFIYFQF